MISNHHSKQKKSFFLRPGDRFGILGLVLILFIVMGCGGPQQHIQEEKSRESGPPAWINQTTTHPEYLYFVGIADRANSLKEGRDQARQDAANQASSYIGIHISSETFIQDSTTQSNTFVDEQTHSSTDASISFLEVTDEYYVKTSRTAGNYYEETYAVYVLCRFPKASAQKEKERQAKSSQKDGTLALTLYQDAMKHLDTNQPMAAYDKIERARILLSGIPDSVVLNHPDIMNTRVLSTEVSQTHQMLRSRSRTIKLDGNTTHSPAFKGALAKAISKHGFELNPAVGATRFSLTTTITLHQGKQIWNQFQFVAAYTYGIKDRWTANTITGGSGETKAFASSEDVASQNAIADAATDIGQTAGRHIEAYLSPKTE